MAILPPDELDRLHDAVLALDPTVRREMLRILEPPAVERARWIGRLYEDEGTRTTAELLIDAEEGPPIHTALLDALQFARYPDEGPPSFF